MVGGGAFEGFAFDYFVVEDVADDFLIDGDADDAAEFAADGGDYGIVVQKERGNHVATGGILAVAEFDLGAFLVAFFCEEVELFDAVVFLGIEVEEIDFEEEALVDWLGEEDLVEPPLYAVGEDDPFDALVGGVIDALLYVAVVEVDADRFDFDELRKLAFDTDSEITECASDGVLGGEFRVFVVTEDVGQQVLDDSNGVGFGNVTCFLLDQIGRSALRPVVMRS